MERHPALFRTEVPVQVARHVGVEGNGDRLSLHGRRNGLGAGIRHLGRTAVAGDLTEQLVQRDRRIGQADHAADNGEQRKRRSPIVGIAGLP